MFSDSFTVFTSTLKLAILTLRNNKTIPKKMCYVYVPGPLVDTGMFFLAWHALTFTTWLTTQILKDFFLKKLVLYFGGRGRHMLTCFY